jgi:hypothetical protein
MVLFTKGYFPICLLLSASNFPIMTDPAQHEFSNLSPIYSLPSPFSRVSFEQNTYARFLSPLCQCFPVRIISVMCKFSSCVLHPI